MTDLETIERRLSRLEGEMRWIYSLVSSHESSIHPEMDEPDPEPVTSEEGRAWRQVIHCINAPEEDIVRAKAAIGTAIALGLASPAGWVDPATVGPLVCDHETVNAYYRGYGSITHNEEIAKVYAGVAAVVAHLNERSAQ